MKPTRLTLVPADSLAALLARAHRLREDILQTFAAAERWNRLNVPQKGLAIDPDPYGQLKQISTRLGHMLESERVRNDNEEPPK